jgi:hypothetical protein
MSRMPMAATKGAFSAANRPRKLERPVESVSDTKSRNWSMERIEAELKQMSAAREA